MATKRKRKRRAKGKVKVRQSMQIKQKSDTTLNDSTKKAESKVYHDNGANFKVRLKRKRE